MIGSYADWESDSEQYQWLERDLMAFNRSNTPWLVAAFHSPWYVLSCFATEHHTSAALGKSCAALCISSMRLALLETLYVHLHWNGPMHD